MEKFKIDNFIEDHPTTPFPWYRSLSEKECFKIYELVAKAIKRTDKIQDPLDLVQRVADKGIHLDAYNAEDSSFSLTSVLADLKIQQPDIVFINWYRFDSVDQMKFADLDRYFDDIWYAGPDDIDLFDKTYSWILTISHEGDVFYINLNNR